MAVQSVELTLDRGTTVSISDYELADGDEQAMDTDIVQETSRQLCDSCVMHPQAFNPTPSYRRRRRMDREDTARVLRSLAMGICWSRMFGDRCGRPSGGTTGPDNFGGTTDDNDTVRG
uniref:Uncharacterized protein n=1 Tax=Schizaphis graminum TaxID=13262 RepID=A0A2S2PC72_SCHGA